MKNRIGILQACACALFVGVFALTPAFGQDDANDDGVETSGTVTLGARATDGNSRTKSASAAAEYVRKKGDEWRLTLRGSWNYASDSDGLSARNTTGSAKYDHFYNERRYAYANVLVENDRFAAVDLRTTIGVGMGYQFVDKKLDSKDYSFYEELGVSYVKEDNRRTIPGTENPNDDYLAGRLSGKVDWDVTETTQFYHFHEMYFGFEDAEDVLVVAEQGIRTKMSDSMFTTFGVNIRWDNTPPKGNRRLDVEYVVGVTYTF